MDAKKMLLSLIPWVLFSVVVQRGGADLVAPAALLAAATALILTIRDARVSSVKIIDVAGVATFGVFAIVGLLSGSGVQDWIADYGRGASTLVLALVMLGSILVVPFTEQYARDVTPREYWGSPVFRAINVKISALWGGVVFVAGLGHLLSGVIDPPSNPVEGNRPIELLLNWVVPVALALFAIKQTKKIAGQAQDRAVAAH